MNRTSQWASPPNRPEAAADDDLSVVRGLIARLPSPGLVGRSLMAVTAVALVAACGANGTPAPSTVTVTQPAPVAPSIGANPTPPPSLEPAPGPVPNPVQTAPVTISVPAPSPSPLSACTDGDLLVTNGGVQPADTTRRLVVSFTNTSSQPCTLVGYPGADLVSGGGGVLVHVTRRPALAAHRLTLSPGQAASADIQSSAIDTGTGNTCGRIGTVVVTPPNGYVSHLLEANLPICGATISSVD